MCVICNWGLATSGTWWCPSSSAALGSSTLGCCTGRRTGGELFTDGSLEDTASFDWDVEGTTGFGPSISKTFAWGEKWLISDSAGQHYRGSYTVDWLQPRLQVPWKCAHSNTVRWPYWQGSVKFHDCYKLSDVLQTYCNYTYKHPDCRIILKELKLQSGHTNNTYSGKMNITGTCSDCLNRV